MFIDQRSRTNQIREQPGPIIIKLFSCSTQFSMLDKSYLINLLEELLIYRIFVVSAYPMKLLNLISHALSSINEALNFEHKLS